MPAAQNISRSLLRISSLLFGPPPTPDQPPSSTSLLGTAVHDDRVAALNTMASEAEGSGDADVWIHVAAPPPDIIVHGQDAGASAPAPATDGAETSHGE